MKVNKEKLKNEIEEIIAYGAAYSEEVDLTTTKVMSVIEPLVIAVTELSSESENERLKAGRDYWKTKCELTEDCLEKSPCDPDITSEQIEAWQTYHRFIKEFGVLPPKQSCPQCKTEYTKEELLTNEHCFKCGFEMKGF